MIMPGRFSTSGDYRYGYNGMEMDNETSGNGNSYTTEFRQYDPRLMRWKSLDPLMSKYPSMSPYVAFNNNPIYFIDPYGLEGVDPESGEDEECIDETTENFVHGGCTVEYDELTITAQQQYSTPLGKTPGPDELRYYKYNTDSKNWYGVDSWRLDGDSKFRNEMNEIAKFGMRLQLYLEKKYNLDKSRLSSDITFEYSENEGEFPTFRLNMIYISKNGTRTPVSIPFGAAGDNSIIPMGLKDIDHEYNTNCYAEVLGIVGNIDKESDFIKAIVGDGYHPTTETPKAGDILVVWGKHAMVVVSNNNGEIIYRSGNRGAYDVMEGTIEEIDNEQFGGLLFIEMDESRTPTTYLRK